MEVIKKLWIYGRHGMDNSYELPRHGGPHFHSSTIVTFQDYYNRSNCIGCFEPSHIRTGAITITLILIKILIPFYKYNIRMASFYESRAYSLSLSGIDDLERVKTFADVMATEKIEFDKNDNDYKDVLEFFKGTGGQ